jgi:acylglycerol lipase
MQNAQGLWLRWSEWKPAGEPVGVVFIVSGLAEHSGRYDGVADRFVAKGFTCFALDHQGQGLSEGERKHVERFAHYVDDYQQFVKERLDSDSGTLRSKPRFILGHSMGGLIATHLCMRDAKLFHGAILSAPALAADPAKATPLLKTAARLLSNYLPKLGLENLDANLVSRNPAIVEHYVQDPGVPRNQLRARWASEMLGAMDDVFARSERLTFPFIVLHGADDRIVPLSAAEKLMQTAPSTDKTIAVYPGAFHELFTDAGICDRVFSDMFSFVDDHM